jgi:hypothetical protein
VSGKTAKVKDCLFFEICSSEDSFSATTDSWLREARKKRRAKKVFMRDKVLRRMDRFMD